MHFDGLSLDDRTLRELQAMARHANPDHKGLTMESAFQIAAALEQRGIRVDVALLNSEDPSQGFTVRTDSRQPDPAARTTGEGWLRDVPDKGDRLGGQAKPNGKAVER